MSRSHIFLINESLLDYNTTLCYIDIIITKGEIMMKQRINALMQITMERLHRFRRKCNDFLTTNLGGTQKGITLIFYVLLSTILAITLSKAITEEWYFHLMVLPIAIILYLLFVLASFLLHKIINIFSHYETSTLVAIVGLFALIFIFGMLGDTSKKGAFLFGMILILLETIFARSLWAIYHNKKTTKFNRMILRITILINIGVSLFIGSEGIKDTTYDSYIELRNNQVKKPMTWLQEKDSYEVAKMSYGMEEKATIHTKPVDLTCFTSYGGSLTKPIRKGYFGYELSEVPASGIIYYPVGRKNSPVMYIIHGNHLMPTKSFLGYEYLGEYLARKGYVVVSVDETYLNSYVDGGMIEENDARAVLLLENIRQLQEENNSSSSPLYQIIDDSKIAIAGHSRGGEAVAIAAMYNQYDRYPDNASVTFNYNFNIQTVIAIAPTCDQYMPSGRAVELKDINYFLIHGSHDMDVDEFMGMKQYQNVTFSGEKEYRKAYLYIAGANHGQFNTKWGRYDINFPMSLFLNVTSLMSAKNQRGILERYIESCLDLTIKGDDVSEDYFIDCMNYEEMPKATLIQGYDNSNSLTICNYEEDSIVTEGTLPNVKITANKLFWRENKTKFDVIDGNPYGDTDNSAVYLHWRDTKDSFYQLDLDQPFPCAKILRFDVAHLLNENVVDFKKAMDFTIVIQDTQGKEQRYRVGDYQTIYPPIRVVLSKIDALFGREVYKQPFQTVQIPLKEDLNGIKQIQFLFDQSDNGKVLLDNIVVE